MRYLIVSDTHGNHEYLDEVLYNVGHLDGVLHLGDVENRETDIEAQLDCPLEIVCGNNDSEIFLPRERILFLGGHKVYMSHGHYHKIYYGTKELVESAKSNGCDIALFGHTHCPYLEREGDLWVANPGSISRPRQADRYPTYMILEIDPMDRVKITLHHWDE